MPLDHSKSKSAFTSNVKTLMNDVGKSPHVQSKKQALAIAESIKGRAMGGIAPAGIPMAPQAMNSVMPNGGQQMMPGSNPMMGNNPAMAPLNAPPSGVAPSPTMGAPNGLNAGVSGPAGSRPFATGGGVAPAPKTFTGPIVSAVPGRTDNHFTHVPSGAYVIPADIVSAHGEGNSLAGMNTLHKLFKLGGHSNPSHIPGASTTAHKFAKGGADRHVNKAVPVKLAGGEIVIPPENVQETMSRICKKKMDLDACHKAMDQWVISQRKKLRKTLAALPGPARD